MQKKLKHGFFWLVDHFISEQYVQGSDRYHQARLLVGCILSIAFGLIVFWPLFMSMESLGSKAQHYYPLFAAPVLIHMLLLLWILRIGNYYRFAAISMVAVTLLALFAGIYITGGPQLTQILPLLPVPMVLAFILLGLWGGLITSIVIVILNSLLFWLDFTGVSFVNVSPIEAVGVLRIFNWIYSFTMLTLLVGLYEGMSLRLRRERNLERTRLQHLATHDVLTGLPNRKHFEEEMQRALRMAERGQYAVAIAMVDLNGFKPINDQLGHQVGDLVLQVVGHCFKHQLRQTDLAARLGGDEFALVLNHIRGDGDVALVCEKLLESVSTPVVLDNGQHVQVSASIGVALFPQHASCAAQLLLQADQAMYLAKRRYPAGGYLISDPPNKSNHDCTSGTDRSS